MQGMKIILEISMGYKSGKLQKAYIFFLYSPPFHNFKNGPISVLDGWGADAFACLNLEV